MAKERLSKLQRIIIKILQEWKLPYLSHRDLCRFVAEEMGKATSPPFAFVLPGPIVEDSFRSTFSQSIRNLANKGLVDLYSNRFQTQIIEVRLTKKGKALNLNKNVKNKEKEKGE